MNYKMLHKYQISRYNKYMNTKDISNKERRNKQRQKEREQQVIRQKMFLGAAALILLFLIWKLFFCNPGDVGLQSVNSACEAYRSQVEEAASDYGMTEYVDLILALMMQESSGQGSDVMQSSEGAFNTLYPQVPGGITDVSYSIQCGIQELKYAMDKAEVQSPTDFKRIRLALQGYNFGADSYFSYLEDHNITSWSFESAKEFARIASGNTKRHAEDPLHDPAGPWDYGDQRYPEHVLRYYHPEKS